MIQLENHSFYNVQPTQLPLPFLLGNLSSMMKWMEGENDRFHHLQLRSRMTVHCHITLSIHPCHKAEPKRQPYLAFCNIIQNFDWKEAFSNRFSWYRPWQTFIWVLTLSMASLSWGVTWITPGANMLPAPDPASPATPCPTATGLAGVPPAEGVPPP